MIHISCPDIGENEKYLVNKVLASQVLVSGKYVTTFENVFSKYLNTKFSIATANGTTALHVALLVCGVKPGDKVITTSFSFVATVNAILFFQSCPVFVDIDPDTFNINPIELEKKLKKYKNHIKAIIIVHLFGLPCDMTEILNLKKQYNFKLIEDACQAHGAQLYNKKVGSFGDVSAFSFYATKNMTTGEGGMISTNNERYAHYGRQLINHGRITSSTHCILGYNYRLTDIAAAIGIAQLEKLDTLTMKRIYNAKQYSKAFSKLKLLKIPFIPAHCKHVFHQYTLRINVKYRKQLITLLKENGIETNIYYNKVLYQQPLYQQMGYKNGLCKEAEKISNEVFSIPVHPKLTQNDIVKIIKVITSYICMRLNK
jgi:perosamine synthetase